MNEHHATEIAYKNGYARGKEDAELNMKKPVSISVNRPGRIPPCPCCGNRNTVATTIYEPIDSPYNKFIVSCTPTNGGCGLHTNEHTSWQNAIDAWIKLCDAMPIPAPTRKSEEETNSVVLTLTYSCNNAGCHDWFRGIAMSEPHAFDELIESFDDYKICPTCGRPSGSIKRMVLTGAHDEYNIRFRNKDTLSMHQEHAKCDEITDITSSDQSE